MIYSTPTSATCRQVESGRLPQQVTQVADISRSCMRMAVNRGAAIRDDRDHSAHLERDHDPADGVWRHRRQEPPGAALACDVHHAIMTRGCFFMLSGLTSPGSILSGATKGRKLSALDVSLAPYDVPVLITAGRLCGAGAHQQVPAGDPRAALVPHRCTADAHGWCACCPLKVCRSRRHHYCPPGGSAAGQRVADCCVAHATPQASCHSRPSTSSCTTCSPGPPRSKHKRCIPMLHCHPTVQTSFLTSAATIMRFCRRSIWGHKVYTIYSILSLVFVILIIVTAFITIALTYFQLAVEDHRWWWRSFLCGGSTGAASCHLQGLDLHSAAHVDVRQGLAASG
jgi:Endomembrane protein 70